jgi:2-polyprenyl-6-methoxyphenol hydroxylase-like FAD-dependent oxidoreductase
MLALLLARQGLSVKLLESHNDFEREFRGDTLHPSTQVVLDDLGLAEKLENIPTASMDDFPFHAPDGSVAPGPSDGPNRRRRTLNVPQARFIELLVMEARQYPKFSLEFGARAEALVERDGKVQGVRYRTTRGWREVAATLVVGADGRFSKIRQLARLPLVTGEASKDVLWFKLPRRAADPERAHGLYLGSDGYVVVLPRDDSWQIGYVFAKGNYARLQAAGIDALRASIVARAPFLADRIDLLADWREVSFLQVASGHAPCWYRPGLLLIGDAAHVMSPVAGVGINYAIQDAVVAANVLGPQLLKGSLRTSHLAAVQRRRELPTRLMQIFQVHMDPLRSGPGECTLRKRLMMRVMRLTPVRDLQTRLVAFGGFNPERIRELPRSTGRRVLAPSMTGSLAGSR